MTDSIDDTTRRGRVRRHCSTICIAMVVARFTPTVALVEPVPPTATHAPPAMSTLPLLHLSAYVCASRELCGTATATIGVARKDAP